MAKKKLPDSAEEREKIKQKQWEELKTLLKEMVDSYDYIHELIDAIYDWEPKLNEIEIDEIPLREALIASLALDRDENYMIETVKIYITEVDEKYPDGTPEE